MKEHVLDFIAMNTLAMGVSLFSAFAGASLTDSFILVLFIEGGLLLTLGGLFCFLFVSATFQSWPFRRPIEDPSVKRGPNPKERLKRHVIIGNRLILLGAALFAETVLLALVLY